ncbi:MAG: hypothetical protein LBC10_03235, partial [Deltaproteobacteria bacterium]|nr:hypothetical protein [Deltaproteobacteria bacterium]
MSSIAASSAGSSLSQGISLSGGISFAGLGSGTDFQTMIEQLKKGEEIPKKRLELWRADWQRRVDASAELTAGISALRKQLNSM